MRRWIELAVLSVGLLALAGPASAQPQPFAWWKSEQVQKNLGLTPEQVTRIDTIFQNALPHLRKHKDELDQQEAELSHLIELNAEEAEVSRQVDRVEAIRSHLNKSRTLMLLHMRQVLNPDQRERFKALRDQAERDRRARPKEDPKP
jgi:Spy/CpxP family protein refolding chaperone